MNPLFSLDAVEIIPYSETYKQALKDLNYSWLTKYFRVEKNDEITLSNPKKYIIDWGGFVFYAKFKGEIIGCFALMPVSEDVYELGKMAVSETYQGLGLGKKLLKFAIHFAREHKFSALELFSDTNLKPALSLYVKMGFKEVEFEPGHYERGDIKMRLDLS